MAVHQPLPYPVKVCTTDAKRHQKAISRWSNAHQAQALVQNVQHGSLGPPQLKWRLQLQNHSQLHQQASAVKPGA